MSAPTPPIGSGGIPYARDLSAVLRRYVVRGLQRFRLSTTLQPVVLVDDASRLVTPLRPTMGISGVLGNSLGSPAGGWAGFQLRCAVDTTIWHATGGGLCVYQFEPPGTSVLAALWTASAVAVATTTILGDPAGKPLQNFLTWGWSTVENAPNVGAMFLNSQQDQLLPVPLFLPAGTVFQCSDSNSAATVNANTGLIWTETEGTQ